MVLHDWNVQTCLELIYIPQGAIFLRGGPRESFNSIENLSAGHPIDSPLKAVS